jgi:hypothetical protein
MNLNFFKKYSFFSLKLNFFKIFLKKKINHNNFFLKQTEQIKNLEDTQHLKTQNYLFSIFQKAEIISLKKSDSFNRFVSFSLKFQILKNSLLILYNYKHYFFFFINSKIKNRFYPYLNDKSQKKNQLLSGLVLKHFYKSKQKTNILDNAYNRFFTVEKDTILIVQMPFLMFNLNQNLINKLSDLVKTLQSCFYFNFFNIQLRKNSEIINFSKTKSLELFSPALNLKFKNFFIKYKFYKLKKQNFFYKISLKTIIKNPQKEITTSNFKLSESTIRNYLQILKKLVKMHSSETQALLIRKLNTKIYSFCYYWSLTKKLNYLTYLDQELFLILWRWAYRRHNNKSKNWIKLKYFYKVGFRNWIFANKIKPSEKFEESSEKTLIFFIYLPFHTQISQNLKKFKTLQLNKLELLK